MRTLATLAFACGCLALAGCAGTSLAVLQPFAATAGDRFAYAITSQVEFPASALLLLDARLKSRLVDGRPGAGAQANRKIDIAITRYVTRTPVGVDAPADDITSRVTVRDAASDAVLGAFTVESKNPGTWRTTRVLLDEYADRIAAYLRKSS
jgi:hypothetical protein